MGCPIQQSETTSCKPLRSSSAFMVNTEIGAVLSVMRRNVRWGIQYMEHEDQIEHSLIKSFKEIRRKLFSWQSQWHDINPLIYLQPFLDVIQSDETSAPITGVALSSIYKFVTVEVIDLDTVNVADALHRIVGAVTSCRFEVTDSASEEVVLVKILQVLLACMKNRASVKLSNQDVCDMVNTCFQIVHEASSKGEILQRIARQTMHELVRCIFSHLPDVGNKEQPLTQGGIEDNGFITSKEYGIPCMVEIFQFLCSLLTAVVPPNSNSLSYDEDVPLFSLGLINSAIELGGASFNHHPELLSLVENDLFHSLTQFGSSPSPLILSTICSIVLNLYHLLRIKLKLQLEAFFSSVLMPIAQNKHKSKYQQQEVAMEMIIDLCRQPYFIHELYVNYDCDISCSNVFEDLVNLLSKTACPVNTPLSGIHFLAMEGLLVITKSVSESVSVSSENDASDEDESIWNVKCEKFENPDSWVSFIRKRKKMKKKLKLGADQFNTDPKKGIEFLQGIQVLPDPFDAISVACFLRYTTGLDKNLVGEYLGNHDRFNVDVLHEFANTFEFGGMNLDTALRVFLETFRLPGEAQKIQRFVEAFSERYYQQSPDILANTDAALLLSYSLILLNTDRHSPQVKKKMTEEDFIRNNRKINGGNDLPREYLSELFRSICENEIRMTPAHSVGAVGGGGVPTPPPPVTQLSYTHDNWVGLIHKSKQTVPYIVCDSDSVSGSRINKEMFVILSRPTVAALSAVLDLVEDEDVIQTCIDGFLEVSKIAGCYQLDDVIDGLLISLSNFTNLVSPISLEHHVLSFGNDTKTRKATIGFFTIANTYGDYVRSGWQNVIDSILTLHKFGLLEDPGISVLRAPQVPAVHSRKSSGLMNRFSELLYYETERPVPQPSREHLEARKRAVETVKSCHVNHNFTESKFLQSDSLLSLVQALVFSATRDRKNEETSIYCLEILITVTLNNRDRIMILWECVYGYISGIVQSAVMPSLLVENSVLGLIRICERLLPYKEDLTDDLLKSLQVILKLDAHVADAYCDRITCDITRLVKTNAGQIKSHYSWRTIISLISITARHPEASEPGFEILHFIMSNGTHILPANFILCVNAARQFAESRVGDVARSIKSLDLIKSSSFSLVKWSQAEGTEKDISEMWLQLIQTLRKICLDTREEVRNHAILTLQNCVILEGVFVDDVLWLKCFDLVIFTFTNDLLEIVEEKEYGNMEGAVILSVRLLANAFLHSLTVFSSFFKVWSGVLGCLERFMEVKMSGKIGEVVREVLRECLVVMKVKGILVESSESFWDLTWLHVGKIAPTLQSEVFPES